MLLIPSHKAEVISIQNWVRIGSADESAKVAGISHFIEHLVFKGTKSYKPGEIAMNIEGLGGELNAYTSFDQTVFYVTLPSNQVDTGLKVISEMMSSPSFDPVEVNNEREVVIEEIKRGLDSPGRVMSQLLFATAFKKHTYGRPVIGFQEVIKTVKLQTIKDYFFTHYVPKNMFLVITGHFDEKTLIPRIKHHFLSKREKPQKNFDVKSGRIKEPKQKSSRLKVKKSHFKDHYFYISFKAPSAKHRDILALDVASLILGQNDSSRLVKALRIDSPLAQSIGTSLFSAKDHSLFLISASYEKAQLPMLLNELSKELVRFVTEGPSSTELGRAINNFEADLFYSFETVDSLARHYGHMEFLFQDTDYFKKQIKELKKLELKSIQNTFKKYFKPENIIIAGLTEFNKEAEKLLSTFKKQLFSDIKKGLRQKDKKTFLNKKPELANWSQIKLEPLKTFAKTKVIEHPSGGSLILRKQTETPVVSARSVFLGGLHKEPAHIMGAAEMTARTWISGTKDLSETEIYNIFDTCSASVSAFSGRNTLGLNLTLLKPFEKELGKIYGSILTQSLFLESVYDREKVILKNQILTRLDNPSLMANQALNKAYFGSHPYGKDLLGSKQSADQLAYKHVKEYIQTVAIKENFRLSVTGHLDESFWKDQFHEMLATLPSGQKCTWTSPPETPAKELALHHKTQREQTHIFIVWPGVGPSDPDRYKADIVQTILAGQGGRLFMELRDKKSLAYSVSPYRFDGVGGGYFGAYIACSPEKTRQSVEMLRAEFKLICNELIHSDEIARAKTSLIGRNQMDLQRTSNVNNTLLFNYVYGLDIDEAFKLEKIYKNITAEEIQDFCRKKFLKPAILSIAGPGELPQGLIDFQPN